MLIEMLPQAIAERVTDLWFRRIAADDTPSTGYAIRTSFGVIF